MTDTINISRSVVEQELDLIDAVLRGYSPSMARGDALRSTAKLRAALSAAAEPVTIGWLLSGHGYATVFVEQSEPPEPLTREEALSRGWRMVYSCPSPAPAVPDAAKPECRECVMQPCSTCPDVQAAKPDPLDVPGERVYKNADELFDALGVAAKPETQGEREKVIERLINEQGWHQKYGDPERTQFLQKVIDLLSAGPARVEPLTDEQIHEARRSHVNGRETGAFAHGFYSGVKYAELHYGIGKDQES